MTRSISLILTACIYVLLSCAQSFGAQWDTVVFREDCDVDGMPDPLRWVINNPGESWWVQGRTHFPDPAPWLSDGKFARVENGLCIIEHHLYNPYHLGTPKWTFLGGEIHTVQEFEPNRAYRFEARVRLNSGISPYVPYPNGLVTSFFLYGYDGSKSDEIDFEFLSNRMNDNASYPNGDPVLTNTWDESVQNPQYVEPVGLDLTDWNTFRMDWYPGQRRINWWWLDPANGWKLLRSETGSSVPDEPMALYFNFWAPCYTGWGHGCGAWDDAADSSLQPVDVIGENEIVSYEIDYAEVRASAPVPALSGWGLAAFFVLLAVSYVWVIIRRTRKDLV